MIRRSKQALASPVARPQQGGEQLLPGRSRPLFEEEAQVTCFTDAAGTFCNTGTLVVSLNKTTPPKFSNVSKQLLQACVPSSSTGGAGTLEPIFTGAVTNPFWIFDNEGLRLVQFRIYPEVSGGPAGGSCTAVSGIPS